MNALMLVSKKLYLLFPKKTAKKISFEEVKHSTYIKNLDILPSNVLLSSAEIDLVNEHARETVLKRCLKEHAKEIKKYDDINFEIYKMLNLEN